MSFTEQLSADALDFFNEVAAKPFSQQAVFFLNAYWHEVQDQSEFIFSVAWEKMKYADMHSKGIQYLHQYNEGNDVDFDIGLYFYEILCRFLEEPQNSRWANHPFERSQAEMMTAILRKKELRDKVDVNFDGRVSFLEYLLYQYRDVANPADFCNRSMSSGSLDEHPEIRKARLALEEVNQRIREYEAEKARLEAESKLPGVRGLRAINELAQLDSSPLWESLNAALIKAEAAVRICMRKFGAGGTGVVDEGESHAPTDGALWWMSRDLEEKKKRYVSKANNN